MSAPGVCAGRAGAFCAGGTLAGGTGVGEPGAGVSLDFSNGVVAGVAGFCGAVVAGVFAAPGVGVGRLTGGLTSLGDAGSVGAGITPDAAPAGGAGAAGTVVGALNFC